MKRAQFGMLIFSFIAMFTASQAVSQPPGRNEGKDPNKGGPKGPPPRFELGQVFPPPLLEELNLTPAQQKELDEIRKQLRVKLEQLLTAEQKKTIENFRPRGPGGPGGQGGPPGGQGGGPGGAGGKGPPPGEQREGRPERPPVQ